MWKTRLEISCSIDDCDSIDRESHKQEVREVHRFR
jgi:hypothetical protein